jgi:hypothetical protein
MNTPENIARLREIKRLLDRIQQLPNIAAAAAGTGVHNGLLGGSLHLPAVDADDEAGDGHREETPYQPASFSANGRHNGFHAEPPPAPATPSANGVRDGLYPQPPFPSSAAPDPEPPPIPVRALSSLALREERAIGESRDLVPVQTSSAMGINPWLFVTATAVNTIIAAVLAVVITLGVGRREAGEVAPVATPGKEHARTDAKPKHLAEPGLVRPIELVPIGSRSEPLRLEALKPSRFPLQLRPGEAMQAGYILVLAGLPKNATLSGATPMGSDTWLVASGALRQLEITVPEWSASVIELRVELRHPNGAVAAQGKAWLSVPPPPVPSGAKLGQSAIREQLQRGDRLLGQGDVAAARAIYEQAAALGSAQAALLLGSTYDPGRLWSLGVFGMVGNKERARHWYERADELGHREAKDRLKSLRN